MNRWRRTSRYTENGPTCRRVTINCCRYTPDFDAARFANSGGMISTWDDINWQAGFIMLRNPIENSSFKIRDAGCLPADFQPNHGLRHTTVRTLPTAAKSFCICSRNSLRIETPKRHRDTLNLKMRHSNIAARCRRHGRIVKDAAESA